MKTWMIAIGFVALGAFASVALVSQNSLDVSNASSGFDKPLAAIDYNRGDNVSEHYSTDQDPRNESGQFNSGKEALTTDDNFVSELVIKLKSSYSENIHLLHIQASLIKVKEFVLERYPEDGERIFNEIIAEAFPEYADDIISLMAGLDVYHEWLLESQTELMAQDQRVQQGMIWEKRRELFGSDAEKIWAHELSEMAAQQTKMHQVISDLNQATNISMDERLYQLQTAISEQFEGTIQNAAVSGSVVSKVFFNLESVQQDLASMSSGARQESINDIRRQLGLNEEQVERLQTMDQEREQRWVNGLAYMEERDQLIASVSEYDRTDALHDLREKYFGAQALTIQREEESDFWRYKRRRVFGVN